MGRKYTPKEKLYNETTIKAVVKEVVNQGKTVYKTAPKYHMSVSMLRNRVLEYQGQRSRTTQGRKCDLTPKVEEHIADSVKKMSELGFGHTIPEFQDLIGEYVTLKKLKIFLGTIGQTAF